MLVIDTQKLYIIDIILFYKTSMFKVKLPESGNDDAMFDFE